MARRKRRTVAEFGPHPVDVHVGGRVRLRRTLLGMNLEKLGEALELTYQQVQKNETGFNRIGASRLYQLCHILDVPVGYFFEELEEGVTASSEVDVMVKRETLELTRAYNRIPDPKMRGTMRARTKHGSKSGAKCARDNARSTSLSLAGSK